MKRAVVAGTTKAGIGDYPALQSTYLLPSYVYISRDGSMLLMRADVYRSAYLYANVMPHPLALLVCLLLLLPPVSAQQPAETRRFVIEVAGARIGTMTVMRQPMPGNEVIYTQISDVQVNFLIYKLKVYYKVNSLFRRGQLISATVDAHTNKGNYASSTVWKGDHYDIDVNQYKYVRKTTERQKIDYTVTMLYFSEPTGKQQVYAEYFGDYFTLTPTAPSGYHARLADREDEYFYEQGRLVKVIKKNALKNFVIRPLD